MARPRLGNGVMVRMPKHEAREPGENKTVGLLRELSPGPLAPEARIMPLDQAARIEKTTPDPRNSRGGGQFFPRPRGRPGRRKKLIQGRRGA